MLELLSQCTPDDSGRYVDISPFIDILKARGWSDERLAKNDLVDSSGISGRRHNFGQFWRTIAELARELDQFGVAPIVIKSVREYRYSDTNVDILVPRRDLRRVARHLYRSGWAAPEWRDAVEQLLIERAKLKLPSTRTGILAAHLYGGVSWRYQSDIGLLRLDGVEPNPDQLTMARIQELAPGVHSIPSESSVWVPNMAAELVMQAAHIAFENYRITIGEAVHLQLMLKRSEDAWHEALDIARKIGCEPALHLVAKQSRNVIQGLELASSADFPMTLQLRELMPAWRERALYLLRRGRILSAVNEFGTTIAVYTAVSLIRRWRRSRRGVEDYR